jgi:ascorbate-specific PTS system EIIC-type component UlaA
MNGSVGTSLLIITTITFPCILVGVLFILGYLNKRKKAKEMD